MFVFLNQYGRNFRFYNQNNDFGWVVLMIGLAFVFVWGVLSLAVVWMGFPVVGGWFLFLPTLFTVWGVVHLMVRPVVSARYNGNR